jgi:colicin import membrane protein
MGLFLLKAGSHVVGRGEETVSYTAKDPKRNVVESDQPLDEMMPEKFAKHEGPKPDQAAKKKEAPPQPPGPPDEFARAEAMLSSGSASMSERKQRAKRLREMADRLEGGGGEEKSPEGQEEQEQKKQERQEKQEAKAQEEEKKSQQQKEQQEKAQQKEKAQQEKYQKEQQEAQEKAQEEEKKAQSARTHGRKA